MTSGDKPAIGQQADIETGEPRVALGTAQGLAQWLRKRISGLRLDSQLTDLLLIRGGPVPHVAPSPVFHVARHTDQRDNRRPTPADTGEHPRASAKISCQPPRFPPVWPRPLSEPAANERERQSPLPSAASSHRSAAMGLSDIPHSFLECPRQTQSIARNDCAPFD